MFDIDFWKASGERALKTFLQVLLAGLGSAQIGILEMDWMNAISLAASAAVLSLISSAASAPLGGSAGPSLVGETTKPAPAKKTTKK